MGATRAAHFSDKPLEKVWEVCKEVTFHLAKPLNSLLEKFNVLRTSTINYTHLVRLCFINQNSNNQKQIVLI